MLRFIAAAAFVACFAGLSSAEVPGLPNAYQSTLFKQCDNASGSCTLLFEQVPENRVLRLTQINCTVGVEGNPERAELLLFSGPLEEANVLHAFIMPLIAPTTGGYMVNETILAHVQGGERPKVKVSSVEQGAEVNVYCSLGGQLLNPS